MLFCSSSVFQGEFDLVGTTLTLNPVRALGIDYLLPIGTETYALFIKTTGEEELAWQVFLLPFSRELWAFLLVNSVLCMVAIKLFEIYLRCEINPLLHEQTYPNMCCFSFSQLKSQRMLQDDRGFGILQVDRDLLLFREGSAQDPSGRADAVQDLALLHLPGGQRGLDELQGLAHLRAVQPGPQDAVLKPGGAIAIRFSVMKLIIQKVRKLMEIKINSIFIILLG